VLAALALAHSDRCLLELEGAMNVDGGVAPYHDSSHLAEVGQADNGRWLEGIEIVRDQFGKVGGHTQLRRHQSVNVHY